MKARYFSTACAVASLLISSSAPALSFGVKVQAGLDPATRALLQQLPVEFHDQIIAALNDSRPILLGMVDATFDRLDQTLEQVIASAQCTADGVPIIAGQATAAMRGGFFNHSSAMNGDTAATDMDAFAKVQRAKIARDTTPSDAELLYDNIIITADNTNCHFQHAPAATLADLRRHEIDYFHGQEDWHFLDALHCVDPRSCYAAAYAGLQSLMAAADGRDIASAGAAAAFTKLPAPNSSKANGYLHQQISFLGFTVDKLDVADFEGKIHEILSIEIAIMAANLQRTKDALAMLESDETTLGTLRGQLAAMRKAYDGTSIGDIQAQLGGSSGAAGGPPTSGIAKLIADGTKIDPTLALATARTDVVSQDVAIVVSDRQALLDDAMSLQKSYPGRIVFLQVQQKKKLLPVFVHPVGWHPFS